MMEENTVENIRKTMNTGAFFAVTRKMGADPVLGPANDMDVRNSGLPYPMFSKVTVDGHKISVTADEYYNIQWVADGRVIAEQNVEQSAYSSVYTLDLDKIDGAENFTYVRCQLLGEGGITLTQAFAIDDGGEPQVYQKDTSAKARFEVFWRKLFSMRIFVILKELWQRITGLF